MWAYRLTAARQLDLVEVPTPRGDRLRPGEVLLRTRTGGICGSDAPKFAGLTGVPGRLGYPLHEVVGEVVASRCAEVVVGAQVVGWAAASDGMAEYVTTYGDQVYAFAATADDKSAVLIQPIACVLYALDRIPIEGATVAVIGLGPIGLLFALAARVRGARRVIGIDPIDRTSEAGRFGLDEVFVTRSDLWASRLGDERPEVVIEAVGHQTATLTDAIRGVQVGGTVLYFGIPDRDVYPIDMESLMRRNVTLVGGVTRDRARSLCRADDFLAARPTLYRDLVTHEFDRTRVQQAFETATRPARGRLKVVILLG